ncbi:MAG: prolipoprotein diacylglyceryl transferase family protein [Isosphaeraceae bacterium]
MIGGTAAFFIYRWLRPFPLRPGLDAVALPRAWDRVIGRFGCFLNGCCFGDVCSLPGRFAFRSVSALVHTRIHLLPEWLTTGHLVHPTQLYSVIDGLILMDLLLAYFLDATPGGRGHGPAHAHVPDHAC